MKFGKILIFFTLILNSNIFCEWNPEFCFPEYSANQLSKLKEKKFVRLKEEVKKYLNKSWCSEEKIDLLMDLTLLTEPKICVEIGVFTGSSILPVGVTLKHLGKGKIYAIDAWCNSEAIKNLASDDPNRPWWAEVNMNDAYKTFVRMIKLWSINSYCTAIKYSSQTAYKMIDNIDFLHLDGDYSENGSVSDVNLYLSKVKPGGYILLSNLMILVNGYYPKVKSYCMLLESCDMVYEIENDNAILLRKK